MLETELIDIVKKIQIQKCENNYIEIKSAQKGCPKIFDTLSSFSNQNGGGKIIFGIDENDDYSICGVYDAQDLEKKIMEQSEQMEPKIRPLCTTATIDNKTVVCAEIQEIDNYSKPCYYRGAGILKGSYIRVADGDRHMTEYEVYSLDAFKKKIQDELREAPRADISDIQTNKLEEYLLLLKDTKPNLCKLPTSEIFRLQGFSIKDKPTLAAVMLFSDFPQAFFPQLCITAVNIPGEEMSSSSNVGERFIDNERIDGTLSQMLNQALIFIRRNMKTKTIISSETGQRIDKTEYPLVAIREIILNALIHRDYSIHTDSTPITIKMFSNRLEVENPGGLYGRMTIDQLGKMSPDTRNPFIANAMEIMKETENRYSGIPTIINAMKEYQLPEPKFENETGVFRVTLYNEQKQLEKETAFSSLEMKILEFCKTPRSRKELEEYFKGEISIGYLMGRYIRPLISKGIISLTRPNTPKSKNQKYVTTK